VIQRTIGEMGKFHERYSRELASARLRAMHKVGKAAVRMLHFASREIKDLGTYQTGWRYQTAFNKLYIRNVKAHAVFVERGRRAGAAQPPIAPIRAWALRRGLPASAAWPIARAIARRGIPARPVLLDPKIERGILSAYRAAMAGALTDAARRAK
jgi:hypothetical protein